MALGRSDGMASFSKMELSREGKVGIITLNNPPANTLSKQMIEELNIAFDDLRKDETVKVVILRGEGRFFAAGADIKQFTAVESRADFEAMARRGQFVFEKIEAFTKPVIAVVHGAALGGGLELAMAAHMRIVADDAKLGLPELNLGIIPGFAGTQRLPKLVGKAKATEMILTSDPVTGKEAVEIGLANASYPQEKIMDEAMKLAEKIANKGAISVKYALELLFLSEKETLELAQEKEAKRFGDVAMTKDAKEGITAFIEKRKPNFTDE